MTSGQNEVYEQVGESILGRLQRIADGLQGLIEELRADRLSGADELLSVEALPAVLCDINESVGPEDDPDSPPDWDNVRWRKLDKGETIQAGDWAIGTNGKASKTLYAGTKITGALLCEYRRVLPETQSGEYEECEVDRGANQMVTLPAWHPMAAMTGDARFPLSGIPREDGVFAGMQFEGQEHLDLWYYASVCVSRRGGRCYIRHNEENERPGKCIRVRFLRPEED